MARGAPRTSNNVGRSLAQGAAQHAPPAKRTGDQADLGAARASARRRRFLAVLQHLRGSPRSNRRAQSIVPAAPIRLHSLRIKTTGRARHARARHVLATLGSRLHGVESVDCRLPDGVLSHLLCRCVYLRPRRVPDQPSHHGLGRCHRVGRRRNRSAGHCQERSRSKRKERRNDREYNETQRSNDQAYAEKLRREDLARVARAQNEQIQEEARRRSEMAGKQMSVFIGRFYQAKSAFHGIKRLLRESDTANAQTLAAMTDEIYPRLLAMIGHFEAIPIATAYDYDPKLGAHLSYLLDWLRGMELGCRGWPNHDHRVHVKKGAHCVENGLIHVEPILKHMQSIYRDMHLSEVERAGYVPPDNP